MAVLPDVLAPGLDIIFCGTAVGDKSARLQAYYAGRGNAFWPTLHRAGLTPYQIKPHDYQHIIRWKMGLTDLVKEVFGNDGRLSADRFDRRRLERLIVENYPRILAFTSKRAAREFFGQTVDYGLAKVTIDKTILFVLPSPSGAARRYWNETYWHELAQLRDSQT